MSFTTDKKHCFRKRAGQCFLCTNRVGDSLLDYSKICAGSFFYNCVSQGSMILFLYTSAVPDRKKGLRTETKMGEEYAESSFDHRWLEKVVYLCLAGRYFAENQREGRRSKFIYFNSTGNWSRDAGYNRAEYNILTFRICQSSTALFWN